MDAKALILLLVVIGTGGLYSYLIVGMLVTTKLINMVKKKEVK